MSPFWRHRFCEAVAVLSLALVIVGVLPYVTKLQLGIAAISPLVTALAGASLIAALILRFIKNEKVHFIGPFIVFILFAITSAVLVLKTGGLASPYAPSFIAVTLFAGVFGFYGALPVLIAIFVFTSSLYLGNHLTATSLVTIVINGLVPLVAGFIIWDNRLDETNTPSDHQMQRISSELSEVASRSEVIINAIGDGVIAIDAKGTIQLINPAAQEILGWAKQDAMMLHYKSVLHLTDATNHDITDTNDPVLQALNNNQEVRNNNLVMVTKTGKRVLAAMVISPLGTPGSGVIIVFRDETTEKKEEHEQAEFISTASHEMRTPVASIEGYLGLALNPQTAQIDQKARDFIMKAHESAQHLGRLFQDLLDVSKADDGRMSNNPKVVDVVPFLHDIVLGLTPKAQEKGLQLIYKPDSGLGGVQKKIAPIYYVNLDNDHIREISNNLIENAIKYTPQGSVTVDVNASDDNEKVVISIKDSGIGIPAEDIPHLFQKFYRVDNVDTRQIGGTGLGLYLCRRLAEAMGGRIWLESEYKKGSTFYLELPRIDSSQAAVLQQEQANQAAQITPTNNAFTAPAPAAVSPVAPAAAPTTPTASPSAPAPVAPPAVAPQPRIIQDVTPASSVPRGEALTREQIAAHVARLEAMAQQQRDAVAARVAPPQ